MPGDLRTILVHGSHGDLLVHVLSGHIIERRGTCDCSDCQGVGYSTIKWFDPAAWCPCCVEAGSTDILGAAFVDHAGYCQEFATEFVKEGYSEFAEWAPPFPALPKPNVSICLHPWRWEQDNPGERWQVYSDDPEPDGWCVYTRHDQPYPFQWQPFDLSNEQDFDTYEDARAEAEKRAADYGVVVKEY